MERKLAHIEAISSIEDIEGADRIQLAKILAWQVVVRKDEFKVGDLCVFFEIDSLLNRASWNEFLFKHPEDTTYRLRTCRMRKKLSQGLALPLSILPPATYNIGDDVSETLGIIRYEPPTPTCLAGQVKRPFPTHIVPKTDEFRIQSYPELLNEFKGKEVYISVKCDGSSGTFIHMDGEFDICSRNLSFKESDNVYWEMFKKYNLSSILSKGNYAIQGECVGPGIQKNRLGLKGHEIFVFNVYDINNHKYLDYKDFIEFCHVNNLPHVPIIETCIFDFTIEQLLEKAKGKYESGKEREGIVIRTVVEGYSETLTGRASFKVLSNDFLEKDEE